MKKLSDAINQTTKGIIKTRGFGDTRILTEWKNIVGADLANNSMPVRIKYPSHENGEVVLIVKVNSGWTTEFSYMEPLIIEKIATFFGAKLISRLQIMNSPISVNTQTSHKPKQKLENEFKENENSPTFFTQGIVDSDLRSALESLGIQIHKKEKQREPT